jgi:hypothetical protein
MIDDLADDPWRELVTAVEGVVGAELGPDADAFRPLTDEAIDSLGVSELGMFLLEQHGLDLFDPPTFARVKELSLRELYDLARATPVGHVR